MELDVEDPPSSAQDLKTIVWKPICPQAEIDQADHSLAGRATGAQAWGQRNLV